MSVGRDSLLGQVVAGRYEVVRLIGKGGMGAIYELRHQKLGRRFALKTLAADLLEDAEALARFQREADIVAKLRHKNIVDIIDWETLEDGAPCIVMELLDGEDLAQRIKREAPLPWPTIARIADPILSALAVAHREGIVHRDLKPQNIFLAVDDSGEETPKLLDFGVSKIRHASFATTDARLIGTPAYMSPEQADGRHDEIGPRTDVWAMGAILYEMATGKLAFFDRSVPAILYAICSKSPPPVREHRADAPDAFVELIERVLCLDDARRIKDVGTLRRGLRAALSSLAAGAFAEPLRANTPIAVPVLDLATQRTEHAAAAPAASAADARGLATTMSAGAAESIHRGSAGPRNSRRTWVVGGSIAAVAVMGIAGVLLGSRSETPARSPTASTLGSPPPMGEGRSPPVPSTPPASAPPARVETVEPARTPRITLTLESRPSGAEVLRGGKQVGTTPYELVVDRAPGTAAELRLELTGYVPQDVALPLDADATKTVELVRRRTRPPARRGGGDAAPTRMKDKTYNPFKKGPK